MVTVLLSVLVFGSAACHIYADRRGLQNHVYLFKPLTMVLLLLIAIFSEKQNTSIYGYAVLSGLGLSLAGDIFLMLRVKRLRAGLVSFLAAHICYIVAFSLGTGISSLTWSWAPFLLYGLIMTRIVLPHSGRLKWPVALYEVVILLMAWRALERWVQTGNTSAVLAFLGAVLFVVSDSAWVIHFLVRRYENAQMLILTTYYCAQWFIVLSI